MREDRALCWFSEILYVSLTPPRFQYGAAAVVQRRGAGKSRNEKDRGVADNVDYALVFPAEHEGRGIAAGRHTKSAIIIWFRVVNGGVASKGLAPMCSTGGGWSASAD